MAEVNWESAAQYLRNKEILHSWCAPSLILSERKLRWGSLEFDNFHCIPIRDMVTLGMQEFQTEYPEIFTDRVCIMGEKDVLNENTFWDKINSGDNVAPALASILSFCYECLVLTYVGWLPPMRYRNDEIVIIPFEWVESTRKFLEETGISTIYKKYLNKDEEDKLNERVKKIYKKLMNLEEIAYYKIMRAFKLYQYALFTSRIDRSLSYSLLVATIESIMESPKGIKLKKIDPEGELGKLLNRLNVDEKRIAQVKSMVTKGSYADQFIDFILNNISDDFWDKDYSPIISMDDFYLGSLDYSIEISQYLPEEFSKKYLESAKRRENFRIERSDAKEREQKFWSNEQKALLDYYKKFTKLVLRNTYDARSGMFHAGQGIPEKYIKPPFVSWIPDQVFVEDWNLREKHFGEGHDLDYIQNQNGKIFLKCDCGFKEERKVILSLLGFERIVHNSILNYILKLV